MRAVVLAAALALAACGGQNDDEALVTSGESGPTEAPALPPVPVGPSPEELAQLESRDCRTVADAYLGAIRRHAFAFAALVWDDPVIDDARLAALFDGYASPAVEIADVGQEGAAGSLYCTVTGTLTDAGDLAQPPVEGELVLRRVNDIPGATPDQLRWTLQSSTFVEKLERSGRS